MAGFETSPLPRPEWLPETVWPFQTVLIKADGIGLAVTDVGAGPTLLFVHTGAWSFLWRDLIRDLSADFRCVCFDAPGNGRSECVPALQTTLERAADAAIGVIRALDLRRFTLVAHDLGGSSALGAVAMMPDRLEALVAMNTFAWEPDVRPFRNMLALMGSRVIRELDAWTDFMGWIGSSSFGAGRHLDAASRRAFRKGSAAGTRAAFHYYMRSALHSAALYRGIHAALTGPLATMPVLTIFGEHNDPFGFQRRWKALFPHASQVLVPGGHHFPMCDDPARVSDAIRSWYVAAVRRPLPVAAGER